MEIVYRIQAIKAKMVCCSNIAEFVWNEIVKSYAPGLTESPCLECALLLPPILPTNC